jgi:3-oxoacyl-[acyl-carrier protein] reductase
MDISQTIAGLLDLSGQVALITGASRGIGWSIAELFAAAGARVALLARDASALEQAAATLRQRHGADTVLAIPADVASEAQVVAAVEQVVVAWGHVDVLINNAGLIHFGSIEAIALDDWQRVIGANLTGAYLCSRAVAALMQRQRSGRIVNIASVSGQSGGVSAGVDYAASKGGMLALTKTLARDLAPYGVTVNAIAPGQIDADPQLLTPAARERVTQMIPLGRLGEPREIAYAALFLASPMAAYITGATIDVNGGIVKR